MNQLPPASLAELHDRVSRPSAGVLEVVRQLEGDVLVLGAGGKMGFHLCAMLQRAFSAQGMSNQVIAVSRFGHPESRRDFELFDIRTLSCDLTSDQELEALPDCQQLFFLAGVKFGAGDDPELLQRMNVQLPAQIARRFNNSRIVALSTGCVYPYITVSSGGSVENDAPGPVGDYARSCLGRENAFRQAGAMCCLIRLNYSVDLRYGVLVDIASRVLAQQPVDLTMGYINTIWQGDAIAHIIQAINCVQRPAGVLNITGTDILSVRQVALQFGRLFQVDVQFSGQEAETAWLNNASRAHGLFGPPEIDEQTLIKWVASWVSGRLPTLNKPTHFEVRNGRF